MFILDCTLRDGGYYNQWNFGHDVVNRYLRAMAAAQVDVVELGLRSLKNHGFKGPNAFTSDAYLGQLDIASSLQVAVMVNAAEFVSSDNLPQTLQQLFPNSAAQSPVDIVRLACHSHEIEATLPAVYWLKEQGYKVGLNMMQISELSSDRIGSYAKQISSAPVDVLYFADSLGSMDATQVQTVIQALRQGWQGDLGIHTHDNIGLALQNSLTAIAAGTRWLDCTVTGMGRGPGNAKTEELVMETGRAAPGDMVPLLKLISSYFAPLKHQCGWGTNPFYYLSGKLGIHPSYVQEMMSDSRYSEEDIIAALEQLKGQQGKKFDMRQLSRQPQATNAAEHSEWSPETIFAGREILLLGTGPGVHEHRVAIENYVRTRQPVVVALNTQSAIGQDDIDYRIACHPIRLLADLEQLLELPQPLITPLNILPEQVRTRLEQNQSLLNFGMQVNTDSFQFSRTRCQVPTSLVIGYALAAFAAGKAQRVLMAGFDGYAGDDRRNLEMNQLLQQYQSTPAASPLLAVTQTRYEMPQASIYGFNGANP